MGNLNVHESVHKSAIKSADTGANSIADPAKIAMWVWAFWVIWAQHDKNDVISGQQGVPWGIPTPGG